MAKPRTYLIRRRSRLWLWIVYLLHGRRGLLCIDRARLGFTLSPAERFQAEWERAAFRRGDRVVVDQGAAGVVYIGTREP